MTAVAAYLLLFLAVGIGFIFVNLMVGKVLRPNKPDASKATIYECGEPTIGSAWIQFDLRFYVVALLFVIFDVEVAFFFPWAVVFGKANAVAAVGQPTNAEQYHQTAEMAKALLPPNDQLINVPESVKRLRELKEKKQSTPGGKLPPKEAVELEHLSNNKQLQLMNITDEDMMQLRELKEKKQSTPGGKLPPKEAEELEHLSSAEQLAMRTQEQARQLAWLALLEIAVFFGVLLVGFAYLWRRGDLAWVRSLAAERSGSVAAPSPSPLLAPPTIRQPATLAGAGTHS